MDYAVLLMAHGGPSCLDDVEAYLQDVMDGRMPSPQVVAELRERYARIGGCSPLLEITLAQAKALEEHLNAESGAGAYRVYVGMRNWHPYIRQVVAEIMAGRLHNVIAVCMAPHYSRMSTGKYFEDLDEVQAALRADLNLIRIRSWHTDPLLIRAIAANISSAHERFSPEERGEVNVLFTAHSLPAAILGEGDPYDAQVRQTAGMVADRLNLQPGTWQMCYQSAGRRPGDWLGPDIKEVITEQATAGHKHLIVAPIGFVADHLETLYDLDIECRDLAARGVHMERSASLNAAPAFIAALASIVQQATRE